ncbi:MAG: hypothetical protein RBT35_07700 [Bacteroidales bacterium]|jgi:hypothetical protein|nr:hypothetical protein [Bacteroidales bacterium]
MKKTFLLLAVLAIGLSSCDIFPDGKIWDIAPVEYIVEVTNAQGVDLLNQDNQNAIDTSLIKAVYRGVEYKCSKDPYIVSTKAYMPFFHGLQLSKYYQSNTFVLKFGELDGAKSYTNEELTILWGDGTSDKIKFNRKFRWRFNGDPDSSEEWFLNGTKVSGKTIKIVK